MRVIGLLNWYEENPSWLSECVAAASRLCDHLVAVDGPYAHFPGALKKPFSSTDQADAIMRTAAGVNMGCTIHTPRQPWWGKQWGGEVAKRDFMFKLGMTFADPGDWFFRVDSDEVLTDVPPSTRHQLGQTDLHSADITIWERETSNHIATASNSVGDYESALRCLYRAIPGIRVEQAHFIVTAPIDGTREFLSGPKALPAEALWDVRLEHRTRMRTQSRQLLKNQYNVLINNFEKVEECPSDET